MAAAFLALLCLAQIASPQEAPPGKPFAVMVGDPAPKLAPARWLKGPAVVSFAPGHTYVIEFWATWCAPCKRSIPHLTELQHRFDGKLSVIGIDVWEPDLESVEPFVQMMGDRMGYSVAIDDVPAAPADCQNESAWSQDHGVVSNGWLEASGWKSEGIPTAFVVDGQGQVAWIGDPQDLDQPLAQIIDGSWPLAREAQSYRARMEHTLLARPIRSRMQEAAGRHDWAAVVQCIDEILGIGGPDFADLAGRKFETLFVELGQRSEACAVGRSALDGIARDNVQALARIGRVIAFSPGEPTADEIALALAATQRADAVAGGENAGVLDTLARIQYLQGDRALAAETERRAIARATEASETKDFEERLKLYAGTPGG